MRAYHPDVSTKTLSVSTKSSPVDHRVDLFVWQEASRTVEREVFDVEQRIVLLHAPIIRSHGFEPGHRPAPIREDDAFAAPDGLEDPVRVTPELEHGDASHELKINFIFNCWKGAML
jgi:hypothetical protein